MLMYKLTMKSRPKVKGEVGLKMTKLFYNYTALPHAPGIA